ncbi:MAG: hypothetical protein WAK17_23280, partial [Candidatus Nitrosopolaris sp.]
MHNLKSLLILRHAKSSWRHQDVNDHDRPLNKRLERHHQEYERLELGEKVVVCCSHGMNRSNAIA